MAKWIQAAIKGDLPPEESIAVDTEIGRIALFNVGGTIYAIENCCPHAGAQLYQGFVERGRVICPHHGWSFPLVETEPLCDGLLRFRVKIEGEAVFVEISEDGPRCRC